MFEADLFKTLLACYLVDGIKADVALVGHALFVGYLRGSILLWLTLSRERVLIPDLVRVFFILHFDSLLANRAYNHIDAIVVTWQPALVVICTGMVRTIDLLATIALKRQKVLLMA